MKAIILLILLIITKVGNTQSFGTIYLNWSLKSVQKDIVNQFEKGVQLKSVKEFSISDISKSDTLICHATNNVDCFTTKIVFSNDPEKDDSLEYRECVYQEYIFECVKCAQGHINAYIKMYRFRKLNEDTYISSYSSKIEMKVRYENNEKIYVTFKHSEFQKKEFKKIYKRLKKNVR